MSVLPALIQTQIQELKAQSLATMMSLVGGSSRGDAGSASEKAVSARIVAMSEAGRMVLALPGGAVDVQIPPWLREAAARQPGLLQPGKSLPVLIDQSAGSFRLAMPEALSADGVSQRPAPEPAVRKSVSPDLLKSAMAGQPPMAAPLLPRAPLFPPGTTGDAVEKLTGLRLPLAERVDATSIPGLRLNPGATAGGQRIAQAFSPALAELVLAAALKQGPVAPAIMALIASLDETSLPPDMRIAARSIASNRLDGTAVLKPEALETAIRQSGIALEAQLLKAGSTPVMLDLKAALLSLKAMIAKAQGEAMPASHSQKDTPNGAAQPATQPAPLRAPAQPLPPDLPRLIEGAIERITLQQLASLPEHHEMRVTDDRASGFRITTALPLATQGMDRPHTAMIGLMIEHQPQGIAEHPGEVEQDGGNGSAEPFPWKVRIALDLEETGPVEAEIRLRAQAVSITLWAERKATAATARDEIGQLHKALEAAQFDVTKLDVREGRPTSTPNRRIMGLDRIS